jgi:hypothetical protein
MEQPLSQMSAQKESVHCNLLINFCREFWNADSSGSPAGSLFYDVEASLPLTASAPSSSSSNEKVTERGVDVRSAAARLWPQYWVEPRAADESSDAMIGTGLKDTC